jgi:hypothetical protein
VIGPVLLPAVSACVVVAVGDVSQPSQDGAGAPEAPATGGACEALTVFIATAGPPSIVATVPRRTNSLLRIANSLMRKA